MRLVFIIVFLYLALISSSKSEQVNYAVRENSLIISLLDLNTNCCSAYSVDYSIQESENIIRVVFTDTSTQKCRCMCNIDLDYRISGLQKGKYRVFTYIDELKKFGYSKDMRRQISKTDIEVLNDCLEQDTFGKLKQGVCKSANQSLSRADMKSEIEVFPNPSNSMLTIRFFLKERTDVEIKILNFLGKELVSLEYTNLPEGINTVSFSADDMPSGMYLGKLSTKSGSLNSFRVVWSK